MLSRLCLFDTFVILLVSVALISLCPPRYADVVDKVKESPLIDRWLWKPSNDFYPVKFHPPVKPFQLYLTLM